MASRPAGGSAGWRANGGPSALPEPCGAPGSVGSDSAGAGPEVLCLREAAGDADATFKGHAASERLRPGEFGFLPDRFSGNK